MGILTGKAKAPPLPAVQPLPAPVVAPSAPQAPVQTDEEISATARTESLLRRSRSRFGTILTGFKGFLSPTEGASGSASSSGRKTLLGE